jgi:hypothetical protein
MENKSMHKGITIFKEIIITVIYLLWMGMTVNIALGLKWWPHWLDGITLSSTSFIWLPIMLITPFVFSFFMALPFLFMYHGLLGKCYISYRICFAAFCLACFYIMGLLGFLARDGWWTINIGLALHLIPLLHDMMIRVLSIAIAVLFVIAYLIQDFFHWNFLFYFFDVAVIAFMIFIGIAAIGNYFDPTKETD